ncbi:MAG: hypothetical protein ACREMY_18045, partial [bacterium]
MASHSTITPCGVLDDLISHGLFLAFSFSFPPGHVNWSSDMGIAYAKQPPVPMGTYNSRFRDGDDRHRFSRWRKLAHRLRRLLERLAVSLLMGLK